MKERNMYGLFFKNLVHSYMNGDLENRLLLQNERKRALSIVLNGPSVNRTIQYLDKEKTDIMMANYAPLTPLYGELNPQYICFADEFFGKITKKNKMLRDELIKTNGRTTIFLPHYLRRKNVFSNKSLKVQYVFSPKEIPRFDIFSYRLLEGNIVAPKYYNVAIMCIYVGIQLGYKTIYLYGADEDFMKELSVDEENRVIRESVHYYGKETFCENIVHRFDMEMMMYMGYMVFKELKKVKQYALKERVRIINMSDSSWIDIFERFRKNKG